MNELVTQTHVKGYIPNQKIGSVSFGVVWSATHIISNTVFALKIIEKKSGMNVKNIETELSILKDIKHPYIISLLNYLEDEHFYYFVFDLAEGGALSELLTKTNACSDLDKKRIFAQISSVVDYLHNTKHIIHRDLKPENILLNDNKDVQISDFGLSQCFTKDKPFVYSGAGSIAYAAPEVLRGGACSTLSDIWSLGVILYFIVCGYLPFVDNNKQILVEKILNNEVVFPRNLTENLLDLLKRMLRKNPSERISITEVIEHPWLKDSGEMKMVNFTVKNFKSLYSVSHKSIIDKLNDIGADIDRLQEDISSGKSSNVTCYYYHLLKKYLFKNSNEKIQAMIDKGEIVVGDPELFKPSFSIAKVPMVLNENSNHSNVKPEKRHLGPKPSSFLNFPLPIALNTRRNSKPAPTVGRFNFDNSNSTKSFDN